MFQIFRKSDDNVFEPTIIPGDLVRRTWACLKSNVSFNSSWFEMGLSGLNDAIRCVSFIYLIFVHQSKAMQARRVGMRIIINYLLKGKFKNLIIFIPIVIKVNVLSLLCLCCWCEGPCIRARTGVWCSWHLILFLPFRRIRFMCSAQSAATFDKPTTSTALASTETSS